MDERQLRILRELGELGSVSAVAEALRVTPSAISQQLRLLQRSVPLPLTERAGRRVVLTEAGRVLADAAIEVESALARARHTLADYAEQPAGEVSVAAFSSAAAAFFPPLLRACTGPGTPQLALADEDVAQDRFPALTRAHDLVLAHRLDHAPPWPPILATLDAVATVAGRPLRLVHRVNEFTVSAALVAEGGGLALLPRWTVPAQAGVVLRPLDGVHALRNVDVLHRPARTARRAVGDVLKLLERVADEVRGGKAGPMV
ncbi:LysR family transcriptional regulator [Streptomyces sp. NEAU-H3]|uniref:LysR family transcriptional regulator n=1 Tax=Streptomyces sp. NEAU-H3 TaxID=2720636 RepID=UPI00143C6B9C|nr:LysR family transcriptional regulator [Streptomyces sp. NEAU-H3]NJA56941.1 LysR family transcriptional regulator [Streptomyces sp. NEAU-H3]